MAKRQLSVVIYREEDQYVARCLEVEVSSFGDTFDHAKEMIAEALELYFEETSDPDVAPVDDPILTTVEINPVDA